MERDLDLKKLGRMFLLNSWIMILLGVVFAVGLNFIIKDEKAITASTNVVLVHELDNIEDSSLTTKKNTYFDTYRALLNGNTLKNLECFTDDEKSKLNTCTFTVEYSCFTISMNVHEESNIEDDYNLMKKYIKESEKWMRKNFGDESITIEIVSENATISNNNNSLLVSAIGFIVGVIAMGMLLFVWFLLDKKVRFEEDVEYYMDVECLGTLKRRQ